MANGEEVICSLYLFHGFYQIWYVLIAFLFYAL